MAGPVGIQRGQVPGRARVEGGDVVGGGGRLGGGAGRARFGGEVGGVMRGKLRVEWGRGSGLAGRDTA